MVFLAERLSILDLGTPKKFLVEAAHRRWNKKASFDWRLIACYNRKTTSQLAFPDYPIIPDSQSREKSKENAGQQARLNESPRQRRLQSTSCACAFCSVNRWSCRSFEERIEEICLARKHFNANKTFHQVVHITNPYSNDVLSTSTDSESLAWSDWLTDDAFENEKNVGSVTSAQSPCDLPFSTHSCQTPSSGWEQDFNLFV